MERTPTYSLESLTLPPPTSLAITFLSPFTQSLRVPAGSTFSSEWHWHLPSSRSQCHSLAIRKGTCVISYAPNGLTSGVDISPAGATSRRLSYARHSWQRYDSSTSTEKQDGEDLEVVLEASGLYWRNRCSIVLDKARYPYLSSTPLWLRTLFRLLHPFPDLRAKLVDRLLWVQLQVTNEGFGQRDWHGQILFAELWHWMHPWKFGTRPPDSIMRAQWRSADALSAIVQKGCSWLGRWILGMKESYEEYSPRGEGTDSRPG